jgi:hypothetical protein
MSTKAKLNVVLACAIVIAIAGLAFAIQAIVIAYANEPVPQYLLPFTIIAVLATVALVIWSAALSLDLS